jgi:hypothetical protein
MTTTKKWIVHKMEVDYTDDETGKVPWGVFCSETDLWLDYFTTKSEAQAFASKMNKS